MSERPVKSGLSEVSFKAKSTEEVFPSNPISSMHHPALQKANYAPTPPSFRLMYGHLRESEVPQSAQATMKIQFVTIAALAMAASAASAFSCPSNPLQHIVGARNNGTQDYVRDFEKDITRCEQMMERYKKLGGAMD
ncbi:MAG: hypothetical protein JOS17DRAFT_794796 [Linnemannia elongata]|nr:MAG: hypothetical protein JOS17DRAFT_794796 [Linnemannia elongata]